MQTNVRPFLFLAVLSVVAGCSSEQRPDGMPPLCPCQITITQEGKPLEGTTVRLLATGEGTRWHCSAVTGANGVANLLTQGQFSGVPEGIYKVTVQKVEVVSLATPEQLAALEKAKAKNPQWYESPNFKYETWQLVEQKHTLAESTPHEMTVSKGQNNATFDVGAAVRVKKDNAE